MLTKPQFQIGDLVDNKHTHFWRYIIGIGANYKVIHISKTTKEAGISFFGLTTSYYFEKIPMTPELEELITKKKAELL